MVPRTRDFTQETRLFVRGGHLRFGLRDGRAHATYAFVLWEERAGALFSDSERDG